MGYIEQFKEVLISNSFSHEYDKAVKEWVFDGEKFKRDFQCICGHVIEENMVVYNNVNHKNLIVGNCCIKKFGIERNHFNKSRLEYLRYTWRRAKTKSERKFVEGLGNKCKEYDKLFLTPKQKEWLEKISGQPYRWKCNFESSCWR